MKERLLLFATSNAGKLREAAAAAGPHGYRVVAPHEICSDAAMRAQLLHRPDASEPGPVDETGSTYAENARLKADAYRHWCRLDVLADDTGLEVEALDGAPGIRSARYAGESGDARANMEKLLRELQAARLRAARFRCCLYLARQDAPDLIVEEEIQGRISEFPRGEQGFGYDPVFEVSGTGKTLAELKEHGAVETHRTKALARLFQRLAEEG